MGLIDKRLAELGIVLPVSVQSAGNYLPWVRTGNLVFLSGQGAVIDGMMIHKGKVGSSISEDDAYTSARLAAINVIAQLRDACDGDLDGVKRFVRLMGFVNCTPIFRRLPKILDGASDVVAEIFGDKGRHARFVAGVNSLPFGLSVTIEAIVEIA